MDTIRPYLPGVTLVSCVAALGELLAPKLGAPSVVLALAAGAILGNAFPPHVRASLRAGLELFTKKILKVAIVVLGLKFVATGQFAGKTLILVPLCLVVAIALGFAFGRLFAASPRSRLLLGCGTAICGATAVVTVAPLIDAKEDEVAFSVATIFLFNVVALFAFPSLGRHLGLDEAQFAAWVGTAVNDTSAVVATSRAYSAACEAPATAIKLLRTLALVPMAFAVAAYYRGQGVGRSVSFVKVFPWFVLGFAGTAMLANTVVLPQDLANKVVMIAGYAITGVLAAVGLNLDARKIAGSGARSLLLGFAIAGAMAVVSLVLVRMLGVRG